MNYLDFIVAILATYRLAQLVTIDVGPFEVFDWARRMVKRAAGHWQNRKASSLPVTWEHFWASLFFLIFKSAADGIECPFCVGVWAAAFTLALSYTGSIAVKIFLLWLAIAGAQAFLQELSNANRS